VSLQSSLEISDREPLSTDALSSTPPTKDGETLVPSVSDVLISLASLDPAAASDYIDALLEQLRLGVDVKEALNETHQQLIHVSPTAQTRLVNTLDRPLVFP